MPTIGFVRRERLFYIILMSLAQFLFQASAQTLVAHGDTWRYRKGTSANPAGWKTAADANLNATWLTGAGGFGYADNTTETSLCKTLLTDMDGSYGTVAMHKSFEITTAPDSTLHL